MGVKTRNDDRQTRRTRKRVRKRNNKKSNQKRKEMRKREFEPFRESMKDVSRRTAEEIINVNDTTGYGFSESDMLLFGKGQKFVPTPKRVDLVKKKNEDFLEFSHKLRLKGYFHNRDSEHGGGNDHISVREQGKEDLEFEYEGPTPWKKNSEFEPYAGENETVEEFLGAVYKDLFNPKNRRYVKDNLSGEERESLIKFMGWNKDENNPRVIRIENKGSSFVVDWKTDYFGRCEEYIKDKNTFRSEDRDLSAEHAEEVMGWAEKWERNEVLKSEEANWVRIDNPKPARLYASVKTLKNGWPFRFILSARGSATENLARWVECQLKVIATKHKAYISRIPSHFCYT